MIWLHIGVGIFFAVVFPPALILQWAYYLAKWRMGVAAQRELEAERNRQTAYLPTERSLRLIEKEREASFAPPRASSDRGA